MFTLKHEQIIYFIFYSIINDILLNVDILGVGFKLTPIPYSVIYAAKLTGISYRLLK